MKICGLQKTTLLDYPGHLAATIFLGGCNFRCPFCHNKDLLGNDAEALYTEEELMVFLKKRVNILEGVCITGGEPTLSGDLESLILKIRDLGYLIKLDTNGSRPDVLKRLCENGLIDYVAMDIKNSVEHYGLTAGAESLPIGEIEKSIDFLMHGSIDYEFRTTVVRELHHEEDFIQIGRWIHGCRAYFLQNYVDSDQVLQPGFTGCTKEELMHFRQILLPHIPNTELRGVD
ncbi:anaerobic ribonucleoside-triphosphate reductase activating protein [Clostridium sp. chh4-2]|uniref:anaerobic ribonucleoside-triphosphate reductase activating protein n=1 Tax=Clostridium sp. chh4-2 TaxID=2067550 RepID=UPI000CCE5231|nr:anaerobic ribonucleoside-triphosphate reductase activating protein [Clostridium sp. chh4-2]PNV58955.1 anaerobic ribonucleoside-triphosphate reductase activating protein [Clostridium sp. chh4-2]